jgi:hypothetical protein
MQADNAIGRDVTFEPSRFVEDGDLQESRPHICHIRKISAGLLSSQTG